MGLLGSCATKAMSSIQIPSRKRVSLRKELFRYSLTEFVLLSMAVVIAAEVPLYLIFERMNDSMRVLSFALFKVGVNQPESACGCCMNDIIHFFTDQQ